MGNKTMGQIIYEYRKQKGLTQKALAEQLNITDKAISKWERDIARPSIDMIPDLAGILDIPVETLLNITATKTENPDSLQEESSEEDTVPASSENDNLEAWDPEQEVHKDTVRHLLLQGILGFAVGFLLNIITSLSDQDPFNLTAGIMIGLLMAGVLYGWELLGKIIGNWFVVGSVPIMIIVLMCKLFGAILIGWVAYPIALLYNLMKAQKKGSKGKLVTTVLLIAFVVLIVAFLLWMTTVTGNRNSPPDIAPTTNPSQESTASSATSEPTAEATVPPSQLVADGTVFDTTNTVYIDVCGNALEKTIAEEKQDADFGYEIIAPSSVKAAYFLTVKEPGTKHHDYGDNVYISNAVIVITSYEKEITHGIEREEFIVWVYPNFTVDSDSTLHYEAENEYEDSLGSEKLADVYEWICEEYDDMMITELELP